MSPSLTFDPEVAYASHDTQSAQAGMRANKRSNTKKSSTFVERRQIPPADAECTIRSPAVLGFAGLVGGLLLSAALIMLVALILAIYEAHWSHASQYCVITVLTVFGTAGAMMYWDVAHVRTRILAFIEPVVERRNYYLHLSSLDAFENVRTLNSWLPAAAAREATRSVHPRPVPAEQSVPTDPRHALRGNALCAGAPRAVADARESRAALLSRQTYRTSRRRQFGMA